MPVAKTDAMRHELKFVAEYRSRLADWSDIREQMPLLYGAARQYQRPQIAELGVRTGLSTSALLAGAAVTGGHVWSVDSGLVTVPDWWAGSGLWSFLAADDLSEEAARWLPGRLDILFIDTLHTFYHTLDELHWYAPRVRPGGMVLCHDVELRRDDEEAMGPEWVRAVAAGPEYPVAAALNAYCDETGLTWTRQEDRPDPAPGKPFYGLGTIMIPGSHDVPLPGGSAGRGKDGFRALPSGSGSTPTEAPG